MSPALKKKVGPLPLWAWIVVVGGTIAVVIIVRKKSAGTASASTAANTVDPNNPLGLTYAQEASDEAQGIDPTTGQPYTSTTTTTPGSSDGSTGGADSGGGDTTSTPAPTTVGLDAQDEATLNGIAVGLSEINSNGTLADNQTGTSAQPTFAQEIGDVTSGIQAISALQAALGLPTAAAAGTTAAAAVKKAAAITYGGVTGPIITRSPEGTNLGAGYKKVPGSGNPGTYVGKSGNVVSGASLGFRAAPASPVKKTTTAAKPAPKPAPKPVKSSGKKK